MMTTLELVLSIMAIIAAIWGGFWAVIRRIKEARAGFNASIKEQVAESLEKWEEIPGQLAAVTDRLDRLDAKFDDMSGRASDADARLDVRVTAIEQRVNHIEDRQSEVIATQAEIMDAVERGPLITSVNRKFSHWFARPRGMEPPEEESE